MRMGAFSPLSTRGRAERHAPRQRHGQRVCQVTWKFVGLLAYSSMIAMLSWLGKADNVGADAFYLPGTQPVDWTQGEHVNLMVW